jgi:hypothetical protein
VSEVAGRCVYYLLALAIIAMVVVSAAALSRPLPPAVANPSAKTIQVTGTGTVSAAPDQALLYLAVQTQGSTATQATADNAAAMTRVVGALTAAGVDKSSIQTVSYTLTPINQNEVNQSMPPVIIGYVAINEIQVTLNDLGSVGKVIDAAIAAGVNQVQGITFTLSTATLASVQKQAQQLALQDADGQAKGIATTLGVSIVGPVSITPGYEFQPLNYARSLPSAQTPIQPGTLQVTATVQVTYQFN